MNQGTNVQIFLVNCLKILMRVSFILTKYMVVSLCIV